MAPYQEHFSQFIKTKLLDSIYYKSKFARRIWISHIMPRVDNFNYIADILQGLSRK